MKKNIITILLIILIPILCFNQVLPKYKQEIRQKGTKATVTEIVSPVSIKVKIGEKENTIRLIGCLSVEDEKKQERALWLNKQLLLNQEVYLMFPVADNNELALVYYNETNWLLNATLLDRGLAVLDERTKFWLLKEFAKIAKLKSGGVLPEEKTTETGETDEATETTDTDEGVSDVEILDMDTTTSEFSKTQEANLDYKFRKDEKQTYNINISMNSYFENDNKDAQISLPQEFGVDVNILIQEKINEVFEDKASVLFSVKDLDGSVKVEDTSVPLSQNIIGIDLDQLQVSADVNYNGKIENINLENEMLKSMLAQNGLNMENMMIAFPEVIPEKQIKIGDEWEIETEIPFQTSTTNISMFLNLKNTFSGIETINDYECAIITIEGEISVKDDSGEFSLLKIEGNGKMEGILYFALNEGIVYSSFIENDIELSTTVDESTVKLYAIQEISFKLQEILNPDGTVYRPMTQEEKFFIEALKNLEADNENLYEAEVPLK